MLLINKVQKNAKEVAKMFGVDEMQLTKLNRHSVFDLSNDRKKMDMGTKRLKNGVGLSFPSNFFVRDDEGNTVEIRYCRSIVPVTMENRIIDKYEPRSVDFLGESDQKADLDEALYFYLHPKNALSPFRQSENNKFNSLPDYIYDDKKAKATSAMKALDSLTEALVHARTVSGDDMVIFAKGMGIGNVDGMDEDEVRAELAKLAQADPATYLKRKDKRLTEYEGRVINAIDKGIFKIEESFGNKRWVWNTGTRKGEVLVDITNPTMTDNDVLVNFMKENVQEYYTQLANVHSSLNADNKAEAFLSGLSEEIKPVLKKEDYSHIKLPEGFEECKEYLGEKRGSKSPAWASKLNKAIQSGEVTAENIDEWVQKELF